METKSPQLNHDFTNWISPFAPRPLIMRPVLMKHWIKAEYTPEDRRTPKPGTSRWSDEFTVPGYFHHYGVHYEEIQNGTGGFTPAPYTTAIIENMDGTVTYMLLDQFRFVNHEVLKDEEKAELMKQFEQYGLNIKNLTQVVTPKPETNGQ